MSYIDALIAQGGKGFDAAGTLQNINVLNQQRENIAGTKTQNALQEFALAQAPVLQERATKQYNQEQQQYERQALIQASGDFVTTYRTLGKEAAMQVLANFPETGNLGPVKQWAMQALQSPDPNDDEEVLAYATSFAQQGQKESSTPVDVATFNAFSENLSPEDKELARRIELGLDPRAMGSAVQTITDKGIADRVAVTEQTISKGKETGNLQAQLALKPEVESAVTSAVSSATAIADQSKTKKDNATTFAVYETAMSSLMDGLGNTDTGPFVGRIPAVTANQQIADGAIAAIAPVLKQLFRAAGEGIFTDKDQELLLAMVPKRSDLPAARESKFRNIDAIVRAKLGIQFGGGQEQSTLQPTTTTGLDELSDEELLRKLNDG